MKKCYSKSWSGGGPRPMVMLKSIGVSNLLQVGMFQYTSDDAELAITEQAEVTDRHITFKRDADRLRASCVKRQIQQTKCAFLVNVRFGEQVIQGTDEIMYGWHVTNMVKHDYSNYRKGSRSMYSGEQLAMCLLPKVIGLAVPTSKVCNALLRDVTLDEINRNLLYKVKNVP